MTAALEEKAAEYAIARREQMDEESFKEAQEHFTTEVESLKKKKIKDQEDLMEQRRLEQELKEAKELKAELEKRHIDEEKAAAMHGERVRLQLEKKARRKEKMRDGVAILGVVAGVVSAVVGVVTMNPGLSLASMAWAPAPPKEVKISGAVRASTTLSWQPTEDKNVAGYRIHAARG